MSKKSEKLPLKPSVQLLVKLGSIVVHIDEFFSGNGHEYDKTVIQQLLNDPEVKEWIDEMTDMAMLPVKR